ncbi:MAG: hypothetical protein M5R36_06470 [Deltaproteobacteria bacterium]|nr:hypothetical protein [Deltaproteobacteria bacterium]
MKDAEKQVRRALGELRGTLGLAGLGAFLLAAHFAYYVTFVQFALLRHLADAQGLAMDDLRGPLALLGACGIAASASAGWMLDRRKPPTLALGSYIAGLAAWLAVGAPGALWLADRGMPGPAFAALGMFLGAQIVLLLEFFTRLTPARLRGIFAGLAAAWAYLAANLIVGYAPTASFVARIDAVLVAAGAVAVVLGAKHVRAVAPSNDGPAVLGFRDAFIGAAVMAGVVLVDSFAFQTMTTAPPPFVPVLGSARDWAEKRIPSLFGLRRGRPVLSSPWRRARPGDRGVCAQRHGGALGRAHVRGPGAVGAFRVFGHGRGVHRGFVHAARRTLPPAKRGLGIAAAVILVGWLPNPAGIGLAQAAGTWFEPREAFAGAFVVSLAVSAAALWWARRSRDLSAPGRE